MIEGYKYKILCQTNPAYDASLMDEINDLYEGGYRIARKAKTYLKRMSYEKSRQHTERCDTASYINSLGQIIDQFVSGVSQQPLSMVPASNDEGSPIGEYPDKEFYTSLFKDADLQGHSFEAVLLDAFLTALKHERAFVAIDAPKVQAAVDQAVGIKVGQRAKKQDRVFLYNCPVESVIDWERNDDGELEWLIVRGVVSKRAGIGDDRGTITETFTYWEMSGEGDGAVATWATFEISRKAGAAKPSPDAIVPMTDSGITNFRRIPFVMLQLDKGLWVGNKIGPQAMEHWRRRSSLVAAMAKSMVAIPYAKLGPEAGAVGGAIPAEVTQNSQRGTNLVGQFRDQGYAVVGSEDSLGFMEPEGKAYEIQGKDIDKVELSMFGVTHQMAASVKANSTAMGRSGLSKQKDQDHTSIVLSAFGSVLREFGVKVCDVISEARGEDVEWVAHGMSEFETIDRDQLIDEATAMSGIPIKSPTFRKLYYVKTAVKLLGLSNPEIVARIQQEENDAIDEEVKLEKKQQKLLAENPAGLDDGDTEDRPGEGQPQKRPSAKSGTPKNKRAA